ncbi:MAG: sulfite exporter TauE/SafE family protein [Planctomycetota bacterium]|jgi:uncharacterized membrane protein YfcA|nr:sulfite exporter TauE/SafE family protein [Planctomycetota bacterium]
MPFILFLALISWIAGFLGGLTGTGGIIMPPLLIELYSVPPHLATAMAQASYVLPSFLATALFIRHGQLSWRVALPLAIPGLICTFAAATWLKPRLADSSIGIIFSACVIVSGLSVLGRASWRLARPLAPPWRAPILSVLGGLVGLMSGITGSGSNAVLVPVMIFFGLELLPILAACQCYAVLASLFGTVGNSMNMAIDPAAIAAMVATQMSGIWLGVRLAQRLDTSKLKRAIGLVCLLAGLFLLAKELIVR